MIPAQLASLVESLAQRESRPGVVAPSAANYDVVHAARGDQGDVDGGRTWWSNAEIRGTFERYDVNDSGKLDFGELRDALRALGAEVDDREVVRMLQACDAALSTVGTVHLSSIQLHLMCIRVM